MAIEPAYERRPTDEEKKPVVLGQSHPLNGTVTQLKNCGAQRRELIEDNLGFQRGRLAEGYYLALLKQTLTISQFELQGDTRFSDGRMGKPEATSDLDKKRTRVEDHDFGAELVNVTALRQSVLDAMQLTGESRVAKVLPITPHKDLPPNQQYPMGTGAYSQQLRVFGQKDYKASPQLWVPVQFYIAAYFAPDRSVLTPEFHIAKWPETIDGVMRTQRQLLEYLNRA